jgi:hypothetical protein
MKYLFRIVIFIILVMAFSVPVYSQCAVCTKTALQLGEKPAQGLNSAILYLMMMPFAIMGVIGYRWWKNNKRNEAEEAAGN